MASAQQQERERLPAVFFGAFACGACAALLLGSSVALRRDRGDAASRGALRAARAFAAALPDSFDALPQPNPRLAKLRKLFVAKPLGGSVGASVDALRSPELFSAMFPGYPDRMREDAALWSGYFSRGFGTKVSVAALWPASRDGATVFYSWLGCLDIFRRYGADIVVLGASDTAQAVAPDLLARDLAAAGGPGLAGMRVLSCETPTMLPEVAAQTAEELAASGRRARWVVYGYTPGDGVTSSPEYEHVLRAKRALLDDYRRQSRLGRWAPWDRSAVFPWSWDDVFARFAGRDDLALNLIQEDASARSVRRTAKFDARVPDGIKDPRALEAWAGALRLEHPFLGDMSAVGCGEFSDARARLSRTAAALRRLADRTLIFVDPTTGRELSTAPPCYAPGERAMVAGAEASVVDADLGRAAGLTAEDFVYESPPGSGRRRFNASHVARSGSRKVARRLAADIVDGERR